MSGFISLFVIRTKPLGGTRDSFRLSKLQPSVSSTVAILGLGLRKVPTLERKTHKYCELAFLDASTPPPED